MRSFSRRDFLRNASIVTIGFAGLRHITGCASSGDDIAQMELKADPKKLFDLPEGFSYQVFSRQGERMDDGLYVPGKHDGM
ncbi:MAG TPA: hypothetical protein VGP94_05215, partial [Tepidisphaeraceae bacterium]|nr:hypothetical protein [Tepidisphaeraceae bacterium]